MSVCKEPFFVANNRLGDGSDSNLECSRVTDPTVTRNCTKPLELAFELGDSNSDSDGKTQNSDGKTVQSDGRKSHIESVNLDEIIHLSAKKLGNMLMDSQQNTMPQIVAYTAQILLNGEAKCTAICAPPLLRSGKQSSANTERHTGAFVSLCERYTKTKQKGRVAAMNN